MRLRGGGGGNGGGGNGARGRNAGARFRRSIGGTGRRGGRSGRYAVLGRRVLCRRLDRHGVLLLLPGFPQHQQRKGKHHEKQQALDIHWYSIQSVVSVRTRVGPMVGTVVGTSSAAQAGGLVARGRVLGARHGIIPTRLPGVAAQQPSQGKGAAAPRTVNFQRLQGEGRATGMEAAMRAQPGAERIPVSQDEGAQHAVQQGIHGLGLAAGMESINLSRSARKGSTRSAGLTGPDWRALDLSRAGILSRTTQSLPAKRAWFSLNHSRITLRRRLRRVASATARLGTIMPRRA